MSEDLRGFMDKFIEASGRLTGYQVHMDEARRLERAALPKCGNCYWWMKSRDCPIDDQRKGFPSCNHHSCGKYQATACVASMRKTAAGLREKARAILAA